MSTNGDIAIATPWVVPLTQRSNFGFNISSKHKIVVTGGTGSFGRAFTEYLLDTKQDTTVRVLSRDEHKQESMMVTRPPSKHLSYILADIRERPRLDIAFRGATAVVHAAALKTVPAGERAIDQFVKTNIYGTQNVIEAMLYNNVYRGLFISSDKQVAPINSYGMTKAVASSLWIQANTYGASHGIRFASVRGGNVWGSRGSVVEKWKDAIAKGEQIVVASPSVTRFHLDMSSWVQFCYDALWKQHGGETFIPKLRAWRLLDLAVAFGFEDEVFNYRSTDRIKFIGPRFGDKESEELFSAYESPRVKDIGWAYVLEPDTALCDVISYLPWDGESVGHSFMYSSALADKISVDELRDMINGSSK
jgi:UDP-N-acetylglucosamine 4,6-dehydratase/5-epimerase